MQIVQNFVDSAVRFTVDSKYGLGALHSVPSWLVRHALHFGFETRLGQTAVSLGLPTLIATILGKRANARKFTGRDGFLLTGMLMGMVQYGWTTRFFSKPLDSALFKSIAARSFVSTLDQVALFATVSSFRAKEKKRGVKAGLGRSTLGALWLTLRLGDIWKGGNQIAFRFAHLDLSPLQSLHSSFGRLKMEGFRNAVDSAIDFTVDSKYGLGALHSVPSRLGKQIHYFGFETRLGKTLVSLGPLFYLTTTIQENMSIKKSAKEVRLIGVLIGLIQYAWMTNLLFNPLDSALFKSIAASSLVSTLDLYALITTVGNYQIDTNKGHKASTLQSTFGALWLTFRLTDIWMGKNQIAFRLMHLDAAPARLLGNQIRGWWS